jgi:hypothetical protein
MTKHIGRLAALLVWAGCAAPAQDPPASAHVVPPPAAQEETDRFPQALAAADEARKAYEKVYGENSGEVDKLLKTSRCQIARIGGLLDRTSAALDTWLAAERFYFTMWNEAETKRVEGQQKSLVSLEADQKRAGDLLEDDKKDREDLMRRKANLEKSARTTQINEEIDGLIKDIQDSEARLSHDQKEFDDITSGLSNMRASLAARLVNIRQNITKLDAYRLDAHAGFEDKRKAAQAICDKKLPDTNRSLPKPNGEK